MQCTGNWFVIFMIEGTCTYFILNIKNIMKSYIYEVFKQIIKSMWSISATEDSWENIFWNLIDSTCKFQGWGYNPFLVFFPLEAVLTYMGYKWVTLHSIVSAFLNFYHLTGTNSRPLRLIVFFFPYWIWWNMSKMYTRILLIPWLIIIVSQYDGILIWRKDLTDWKLQTNQSKF